MMINYCGRLRSSMEGYLDAFDPKNSIVPAGIFTNRVEDLEFECVTTSLMERVILFLNDARENLRCSMAKDTATIKNECLQIAEDPKCTGVSMKCNEEESFFHLPKDISVDFQKKFTFSKHEKQGTESSFFLGNTDNYRLLTGEEHGISTHLDSYDCGDMEKEDLLLDQLLHSRSVSMEELRASRQQVILVASLLDRIPNLAGLARTCEVFKATGLVIADKNVLHDKQFQLIRFFNSALPSVL
ncbi:unnamed protein product [Ilex paraguariensis]|uniref:tRNA/rRNA methyltransferase SpoU type domain-containing protein n=1 Tax=Ilex paraguariensis TaxID=185542 RepID=A0ABC8TV07_9AQUA